MYTLKYKDDTIATIETWQEITDAAVQHAIDQNIAFNARDYMVELDVCGEYGVYAFTYIDYIEDELYPEFERLIADSKDRLGYVEGV